MLLAAAIALSATGADGDERIRDARGERQQMLQGDRLPRVRAVLEYAQSESVTLSLPCSCKRRIAAAVNPWVMWVIRNFVSGVLAICLSRSAKP